MDVLKNIWTHPANRKRRFRALGSAIQWQIYKRLKRSSKWYREIEVFGGLRMRCYPDSRGAGVMLYLNGWPDFDEMHFMRRYLRPGDAFVDVGANIGIYTLLASSLVGEGGRVLAFEPGRKAFQRLEENVRINDLRQVEARFAALGDQLGKVSFLQKKDLTNRIALSHEQEGGGDALAEVPLVTLDLVLEETRYAMGKIDVEGAEEVVFRGGQESLRRANPSVWIVELKDRLLQRFGSSAESLTNVLCDAGYRLGRYDAASGEICFSSVDEQENVLAIHHSSLDEVQARIAETTA